ncbi:MAG TPA: hypothetical protein VFZ31_15580 [Vicinamibacterales bacterium]
MLVAVAVALGASLLTAREPRVSAAMLTSAVTIQNGIADATFKIEITNEEPTAMSDVFVVFADNMQLSVGSVPAEGSATSGEMTRSFDVSDNPSKYTAIPVTLKYSVDGVSVEAAINIILVAEQ